MLAQSVQGARATRLRRYFAIVLVLATLCAGVWIEREALLRSAADLWIVSDAITPADAVVVLGGGIDSRPFEAADLYAKNLVKKVLLSEVEEGRSVGIGAIVGAYRVQPKDPFEIGRSGLRHRNIRNRQQEYLGRSCCLEGLGGPERCLGAHYTNRDLRGSPGPLDVPPRVFWDSRSHRGSIL